LNTKLKNLDSIRTVAFLTTFMAHNFVTANAEVMKSFLYRFIQQFKSIFSFGVPLFFVLSGFLISYLMIKEYESTNSFSTRDFYIRRILRIWPLYYLIIGFGFFLFPLLRTWILGLPPSENASLLMYLSFLSNFDQLATGTLPIGVGLGVTWSVSVEEQFYLFWPLVFLLFPYRKFITGIAITLLGAIVLSWIFNLHPKHSIFCIIYLSVGAMFGYIHAVRTDVSNKLTNIPVRVFIFVPLVTLLLMKFGSSIPINPVLITISLSILMGYIILYQIQCPSNVDLKRVYGLEALGKYTYGLYLYHTVCNFLAYSLVRITHAYDNLGYYCTDMFLRPITSLLLSIIISQLSYHYFESYFLKLKVKFQKI